MFLGWVRKKWASWLGSGKGLRIQWYRGFASETELHLIGTVFHRGPDKPPNGGWLQSLRTLLGSFWVKPAPGTKVQLRYRSERAETTTDALGFFSVTLPHYKQPGGWHEAWAGVVDDGGKVLAETKGQYVMNTVAGYACISDIDDTFLVSHSANSLKKFWLLISRNARTRKPFEGVVKHYQALEKGTHPAEEKRYNPFYYVSSSEWNLYRFLIDFMDINRLPKGVLLLNELKQLKSLLRSGANKHGGKFTRIVRILKAYPGQPFVLLGDDSQQDPYIYQSVLQHFPQQVKAIYIRQVKGHPKAEVNKVFQGFEQSGVPALYFAHSRDAMEHSREHGLIV